MKSLIKLNLDGLKIAIHQFMFIDILEIILQKKGLQAYQLKSSKVRIDISLPPKFAQIRKILEENPDLKVVNLLTCCQAVDNNLVNLQKFRWE